MYDATSKYQHLSPFTSEELIKILDMYNISYKLYLHKPLFSVQDFKKHQNLVFPNDQNGVHIKNFYLRDKKKNNFLFTCQQDKNIDLKILKEKIGSDRLSFGSPERLFEYLGVFPGAVSPFCMLNGIKKNAIFYCDDDLKQFKNIYLHPFVNDRTICLALNDLEKFLKKYHIFINWINI